VILVPCLDVWFGCVVLVLRLGKRTMITAVCMFLAGYCCAIFGFFCAFFPPGFLVVFAGVFIKKESWPPRV